AHAPNPAMTSCSNFGCHWRRVGDAFRWAAKYLIKTRVKCLGIVKAYTRLFALALALLIESISNSLGQTDANLIATGEWSKPTRDENGVGSVLRGRLVVYDDQARSAANHARIYIEIQQVFTNGWYDPVEIYCFGTNLVFELQDEFGQPIPSRPSVRVGAV